MNTVAQFVPPKRQSILLAQRELREQQQDREVKEATKKAREVQRTQKQRDIPVNLFVKACGSIGNAFWTLAISLVLTLLASYLVANPQYLAMLAQPVEQFFSVSLAGASPPSGETRQRDREAEIKVEREFGAEYIGKERQIIEALGQFRRHSVGKYSGSLPLTKLELTPVVGPLIEKVDRTVEFDQLPTNDVLQLPMGQNFTLRSDKKLGAKAEHSLRAAEWKWEVQERDDFGLPRLYKALVTYRGEERWLDYKSLRVVAHYTGYISREDA
ncbi:MAG: hypothetical protein FWC86_05020, partial [Coriobacteriia bacterium]|nr:hypothetical protein [Coriobacteriia bacterium]